MPDDPILIESKVGRVEAVATPDDSLRRGVITMSHGFGGIPELRYRDGGSAVNLLISLDENYEDLTCMPRLSGVPVNVIPLRGAAECPTPDHNAEIPDELS